LLVNGKGVHIYFLTEIMTGFNELNKFFEGVSDMERFSVIFIWFGLVIV
jgi:hypothetical protein